MSLQFRREKSRTRANVSQSGENMKRGRGKILALGDALTMKTAWIAP
jgi:hypothetical protein